MSINYKVKKKKRTASDKKRTLVAEHKSKLDEFDNLEKKLPKLKKQLISIEKKIEKIKSSDNGFGFIDAEKGNQVYFLTKKKEELEKTIKDVETNKNREQYFSKTAHILSEYFDDVKNVSKRDLNKNKQVYKINKVGKKTVIDYLNPNNERKKNNRANMLDEYYKIIKPKNYNIKFERKKTDFDICKKCNNVEMILNQYEGFIVCPRCGQQEDILIDSDKPSYKDPPPEAGEFTYKRINRFDEWLSQYQAKESTEIPQEVLDSILCEMKKEGIKNMCSLTIEKVRGYLKKLRLNKYYEHIPHIIYSLNGMGTPRLSNETEEKLRYMFKQIQDIFDQVCPNDRTNFLSYSYLLYKLLELLGEDEHKKYFRLHKNREKIYNHDCIWKKICRILGWSFIRTV